MVSSRFLVKEERNADPDTVHRCADPSTYCGRAIEQFSKNDALPADN
jgi:hypothetical protein